MDDIRKCQKCGEPLKTSQYARAQKEGYKNVKAKDTLVCRNFPKCILAEKDCNLTLK